MTVDREDLVAWIDQRLDLSTPDYGPNGLQVEGAPRVEKLALGVSACVELFDQAAAWGAQAVLVHHGIFWEGMPRTLTGVQYRRVQTLVESRINLIACHLPLDAHPEIGNNALAAREFGLLDVRPFGEHNQQMVGVAGRFAEPVSPQHLAAECERVYGQAPHACLEGPDPVETLGIISGGAQKEFHQAIAAGLDAYITGETSEWVMNWARESGTHYLAAGHYATETLGVKALGAELSQEFGIEVRFFDVPNPV